MICSLSIFMHRMHLGNLFIRESDEIDIRYIPNEKKTGFVSKTQITQSI